VVLTFLTAPEAFDGHRTAFEAIARSLRW